MKHKGSKKGSLLDMQGSEHVGCTGSFCFSWISPACICSRRLRMEGNVNSAWGIYISFYSYTLSHRGCRQDYISQCTQVRSFNVCVPTRAHRQSTPWARERARQRDRFIFTALKLRNTCCMLIKDQPTGLKTTTTANNILYYYVLYWIKPRRHAVKSALSRQLISSVCSSTIRTMRH